MIRLIALAALLTGCFDYDIARCGENECPMGSVCLTADVCGLPDQHLACDGKADGTDCEFLGGPGACYEGYCERLQCGDKVVIAPEVCDDENTKSGDGCSGDCRSLETCGNSYVDVGEQCDDGNHTSADGCDSTCGIEVAELLDLTPAPPPARLLPYLAFDEARGVIVLWGGRGPGGHAFDDTWEDDGAGWHEVRPVHRPPARDGGAIAYDPLRRRVVLYGGDRRTDTWTWDGGDWTHVSPAHHPSSTYNAAAIWDPATSSIVLTTLDTTHETWTWNGSDWTCVSTSDTHGITERPLLYDGVHHQILGQGSTGIWAWNGTAWRPVSSAKPDNTFAALAMADPTRPVAFAGLGSSGAVRYQLLNLSTMTWSPAVAFDAPATFARYLAGGVYDPVRDQVVFFGGGDLTTQTELASTAVFNNHDHTWHDEPLTPAPRSGPPLSYSPSLGASVFVKFGRDSSLVFTTHVVAVEDPPPPLSIFGQAGTDRGVVQLGYGSDSLGQLAIFDGTTWTTQPAPMPAGEPAMDFAPSYHRLIAVMAAVTDMETWEWDGATWFPQPATNSPPLRRYASVVYDPREDLVLLVGGIADDNSLPTDLWGYSPSSHQWSALALDPASPGTPGRAGAVATYDPVRGAILFLGGTSDEGNTNDIWELASTPQHTWMWTQVFSGVPRSSDHVSATYDPLRHRLLILSNQQVLAYQYSSHHSAPDYCTSVDTDGDGLAGCADPDCWARCTPWCPPGAALCDPTLPHCGDATCNAVLEDHDLCPMDCP